MGKQVLVERRSTDRIAPPLGMYSHAARVSPGGAVLHIAGQVGNAPDGTIAPDAYGQTVQALRNIAAVIEDAGGTPAEGLASLFTMVTSREALSDVRRGIGEVFAEWFPEGDHPANSLCVVAGLAREDLLVEIASVAVVPG
ncbi:RidA family protein [Microtetraspora malaysiensis]|uniref:RidA family protein n=1 Tax=Microtetraspora malaysiensis TaxID=161358 RepID=UPI000ADB3FED|nr:Rid family hydrolase [Microtetraspora malaysiensis]